MRKIAIVLALALALGAGFAVSAQALPTLDITIPVPASINATPGTGTYAGGATPFIGTDIPVSLVTGIDTPLHNGQSLPITSTGLSYGLLNFTTGNFVSAAGGEMEFGPGGSIVVTGIIDGGGQQTQLTGTFVNAPNGDGPELNSAVGGAVFVASYTDYKADTLLDFFGLTPGVQGAGTINLSFQGPFPGTTLSLTNMSGDMTNVVPVPASVLLLGSGLLGLVGFRFRKNRA